MPMPMLMLMLAVPLPLLLLRFVFLASPCRARASMLGRPSWWPLARSLACASRLFAGEGAAPPPAQDPTGRGHWGGGHVVGGRVDEVGFRCSPRSVGAGTGSGSPPGRERRAGEGQADGAATLPRLLEPWLSRRPPNAGADGPMVRAPRSSVRRAAGSQASTDRADLDEARRAPAAHAVLMLEPIWSSLLLLQAHLPASLGTRAGQQTARGGALPSPSPSPLQPASQPRASPEPGSPPSSGQCPALRPSAKGKCGREQQVGRYSAVRQNARPVSPLLSSPALSCPVLALAN